MQAPISSRAVVLQVLSRTGEAYAEGMADQLDRQTSGRGKTWVTRSVINRSCHLMKDEGLLTSRREVVNPTGRPRTYYKLTAKGIRAAAQSRSTVLEFFK
jgi:DNA-binding PadR family transcriptional regulator